MTMLIDVQAVRDYLVLNSTPSTSQYTDQTIGSNIRAATSDLEQATGRFLAPRTFSSGNPWKYTTMLAPIVPLPGFRTTTTITWSGGIVVPDTSCWLLPDAMQTGVFTGIQFRPLRTDLGGAPWYLADSGWFDKALDSPFYPGNYGGGVAYTSMPNDLTIVGEAGYDPTLTPGDYGYPPEAVLAAVKVLASWKTMRPASVMSDVATTPAGNTMPYAALPPEVQIFIRDWRVGGHVMVSVG